MYPYVKPYDAGFQLGLDDIKGIHELYGKEMTGVYVSIWKYLTKIFLIIYTAISKELN